MEIRRIILASQSPRRIEMLRDNGMDPIVMPADVDETLPDGIEPKDAVMYLAMKKALCIEEQIKDKPDTAGSLIIAADTVVYKDGYGIMGKPADIDDARRMITAIRGTSHFVATGVALIVAGEPRRRAFCEVTEVILRDYSDKEIEDYIATQEPYDKAGGYSIQGTFGKYIDRIHGDFDNVVGLPFIRMMGEISML